MKTTDFKDSINLTNDGTLQFFFVGTGSAFNKTDFQNNLLVIKGQDHILIDCGTLCPFALTTYNTPLSKIHAILPTHSHADHIGGLEEMALSGRYIANRKPLMVITDEYKKILWENSLKGGCAYGETSRDGTFFTLEDYFELISPVQIKNSPRPVYETNLGSLNLKLFRTVHVPCPSKDWNQIFYSVGVLVDDRIFFSGDTMFDRQLLEELESSYKIECIFHDCQFYGGGVHASYNELKTLPQNIKSKIILCHYGENYKNYSPEKDGFAGFAKRGVYYNF